MRIFICLTAWLLLFPAIGAGNQTTVSVGVYQNSPMIFMGKDGPEGLYIDVLEHIAEVEEWDIQYIHDSWENVFNSLKSGKIDLLPVVALQKSRKEFLDYTRETLLNNWGQVYTQDGLKIESIQDLAGKKIGLQPRDTHGTHFENLLDQLNIEFEKVSIPQYLGIFKALDSGEIEAGVVNRIFGVTHEKDFGVQTTPIVFNPIQIRYAVPKGDPASLLPSLDRNLAELIEKKDSVYHQAMARWFSNSPETYFPEWARKLFLVFLCLAAVAMAVIFWLRFEIRRKTYELRKSNAEVQDREEKFRQVTENIREVFWLCSIDWSELYYVSSAFEDIWGIDINSLYDKPILLFEAALEEDREKIQAVMKRGVTAETKVIEFPDYRIKKPDGTITWISARAFPIFDSAGKPYRIAGIAEDITNRKNAEFQTQEISRLLTQVTEGTTDAIFIKDLEGRYILANSATCRTLGKRREEIIGKTDSEVFPETSTKVINENDSKAIRTGKPVLTEEQLETIEGDTIWMTNKSPRFDEKGDIVGVIGISRNVTQLKKAETEKAELERRLLQSQRLEAIGNLAGGIAHDFNNILFPVVSISEMMMEDYPQGSIEYENSEQIFNSGKRGRDLVRQILAFSRQSEDRLIPVHIQKTLKEVLKLSRSIIPTYIEIKSEVDEDCGFVMGNPTQLHQIVMNLIINAYHAIEPNNGKIYVALAETSPDIKDLNDFSLDPGRYVMLSVSDNGSGIDTDIIDRVFDPYFTTKDKEKGTGLGLAVAHGIVREYGGDIKVHSEIGKGTTFKVYFPLKEDGVSEEPEVPGEEIPSGDESIMLVDDEPAIVKLEKSMLERFGYKVSSFTNSTEALKVFKNSRDLFSLVITDMTMPDLPGDMLAKELRTIDPDIPIIICTGFSERMDEKTARELGINALLMKPVILKDLARTVREVLDETREENG